MRAIVRDASSAAALLPPTCEIFAAPDLTNPAAAQDAAAGLDAIIHTASVFRRCDDMEVELVQPNIALVQHMVRACAATGAFPPRLPSPRVLPHVPARADSRLPF